jgi:hypothetical protein
VILEIVGRNMARAALCALVGALYLLAVPALGHTAADSPRPHGVLRLRAANRAGNCGAVHKAEDSDFSRLAARQSCSGSARVQEDRDEEQDEDDYDDSCVQQVIAATEIAARRALGRFAPVTAKGPDGVSRLRGGGELSSEVDDEDVGGDVSNGIALSALDPQSPYFCLAS